MQGTPGWIPGQGSKSHMPQLSSHATAETSHMPQRRSKIFHNQDPTWPNAWRFSKKNSGLPLAHSTIEDQIMCRNTLQMLRLSRCVYNFPIHSMQPTFFFFLPHHMACRLLVPGPGMEAGPQQWKPWVPNHWTARELPDLFSCSIKILGQGPEKWATRDN